MDSYNMTDIYLKSIPTNIKSKKVAKNCGFYYKE